MSRPPPGPPCIDLYDDPDNRSLSLSEHRDLEELIEIGRNMMGIPVEKALVQFKGITRKKTIEGWLCKRVMDLSSRT